MIFITHSIDEAILLSDRIFLMTSQPGTIKEEVTIDLPRPRQMTQVRSDPKTADIFLKIWTHLQDEVQESRNQ